MEEISAGLAALGIDASRIHTEPFGPAPGLTPGIAATPARAPHPPPGHPGTGPTVEFARSNLAVPWTSDYASLLELAEACDVPVRWSCRTGVCHNCETTLIEGELDYDPDAGRTPRRRQRAHLLLTATGRRGPRSVTGEVDSAQVHRDTGRVVAFSDGVFAITITLLVLEIEPPTDEEPAARARRPLAFLSRLRGDVPVHRTGMGQPPRHVRPHPRGRPWCRSNSRHAEGRGLAGQDRLHRGLQGPRHRPAPRTQAQRRRRRTGRSRRARRRGTRRLRLRQFRNYVPEALSSRSGAALGDGRLENSSASSSTSPWRSARMSRA